MSDAFEPEDWYSDETATFGDRLAAAREMAGLKQKELAQRVGVKASTLRNWEDDLSEPRANRLSMLGGILGVSLRWLLTGEGDGVSAPDGAGDSSSTDIAGLLSDVRVVRAQISQSNAKLALIEKRLRAMAGK